MPKATSSQQPLRRSARTKNEKKTPAVELSEILESGSVSQPLGDSSTSRLASRPIKIPTKSSTTRRSRREKNLNKSDALPTEEEPEVVPRAEEHEDVLDAPASPTRSLSIPYTYATPDSSQASPIRDADLISQPIRPELVEVYQHIITIMNITSEGDKADLAAVITLEAAAAKLREKAEELRAIARAERGQRERLENFVSTWKEEPYHWSIEDIYEGEYNIVATPDGDFVCDANDRPIELGMDDEQHATRVPCLIPAIEAPFPSRARSLGLQVKTQRTNQKRPRDDSAKDPEEENRYQRRSRNPKDHQGTAKTTARR